MIIFNPCANCKTIKTVQEIVHLSEPMVDGEYLSHIECRKCEQKIPKGRSTEMLAEHWNDCNPLPDPLAIAHEQLAECYDLLETVAMSSFVDWDIRKEAETLLAKHRSANND